jgi:hypothetical protein
MNVFNKIKLEKLGEFKQAFWYYWKALYEWDFMKNFFGNFLT